MTKRIIFDELKFLPANSQSNKSHSHELGIIFHVVDNSYVGRPEGASTTSHHSLVVKIDDISAATWGNNWNEEAAHNDQMSIENLKKVLYEYGKRKIIEEVKRGTLKTKDILVISVPPEQAICPYAPSNINLEEFVLVEMPMGFKI
jgi:hypothetical protein